MLTPAPGHSSRRYLIHPSVCRPKVAVRILIRAWLC